MERQRWKSIVCLLREVHKAQHQWRCRYSVLEIVEIWFWAVIHDRPVSWACQRRSWPIWDHRRVLPSNATMSRRLRTKEVKTLISAMENRVLRQAEGDITLGRRFARQGHALVTGKEPAEDGRPKK